MPLVYLYWQKFSLRNLNTIQFEHYQKLIDDKPNEYYEQALVRQHRFWLKKICTWRRRICGRNWKSGNLS